MCMLSRPIESLDGTNILVTDMGRGDHATVYSMRIDTRTPVAMILPVPVLRGSGDDALRFVDLSGYPNLFVSLGHLYPDGLVTKSRGPDMMLSRSPTLAVHVVGKFAASFVPTVADFARLDPQFRLDPAVWGTVPDYSACGFAVFQLDPMAETQDVHPMAYVYPADNPLELFFPTVHVHDGKRAAPDAGFDHRLYYQETDNYRRPAQATGRQWEPSVVLVKAVVDLNRTMGLLTERPVFRQTIRGVHRNADQVLVVRADETVTHEERGLRVA